MHAELFLHNLLNSAIHKSRLRVLAELLQAIINTKKLQLTSLGRALELPIQERSGIRKVDRVLANPYFQNHSKDIYQEIVRVTIGNRRRPVILVDWSKLPHGENYVLRASLSARGRALTLYEEQHPKSQEGHPKIHQLFLESLKQMLPQNCKPIVTTDAGFKNPWFKDVLALGWDYVGRVRGFIYCQNEEATWETSHNLMDKATSVPQCLGSFTVAKTNPLMSKRSRKYRVLLSRVDMGRYRDIFPYVPRQEFFIILDRCA